jgi:signal peptidase II
MILTLIIIALLIGADQITKAAALSALTEADKAVWDGVFRFTYVENRGAAFGMLSEHRWVFMVISVAAVALIIAYIWKENPKTVSLRYGLALMAAGGAGNMIDRVARGYVVDFIELSFVKYPCRTAAGWHLATFPVFNVADICVTVGCALVIYHLVVNEIILPKRRKNEQKDK